MKYPLIGICCAALLSLSACSTMNHTESVTTTKHANWGVVPFANNTETPQANERAQAISAALLRTKGVDKVSVYQPRKKVKANLFANQQQLPKAKAVQWARKQHIRYVLTGSVNEWHYKVGIDGEPVIGMTMQLIDAKTGKVVWNAVSSKVGTTRASLSGVAQQLISKTLSGIRAS